MFKPGLSVDVDAGLGDNDALRASGASGHRMIKVGLSTDDDDVGLGVDEDSHPLEGTLCRQRMDVAALNAYVAMEDITDDLGCAAPRAVRRALRRLLAIHVCPVEEGFDEADTLEDAEGDDGPSRAARTRQASISVCGVLIDISAGGSTTSSHSSPVRIQCDPGGGALFPGVGVDRFLPFLIVLDMRARLWTCASRRMRKQPPTWCCQRAPESS